MDSLGNEVPALNQQCNGNKGNGSNNTYCKCPKASACPLLGYADSIDVSFKTLRVFTNLPASQMPKKVTLHKE